MSLILQDKIEKKIEELLPREVMFDEIARYPVELAMQHILNWYNEQLIEEIKKMKHNPAKDTHEIGMNQGFTDVICKLKDQSLSDNK